MGNHHPHLYGQQIKNFDIASALDSTVASELEYLRSLKENNKYLTSEVSALNQLGTLPSGYGSGITNGVGNCSTGRNFSSSNDFMNLNNRELNGQSEQERLVNSNSGYSNDDNGQDYDDSMHSLNGTSGNNTVKMDTNKRKHYDEMSLHSPKYKNLDGDKSVKGGNPTNYDYMKNFDGIRTRNFDEMQCDETNRHDYVRQSDEQLGGRSSNDVNDVSDLRLNYASSEDLNQTNSSEHGEKNSSGSDDEGNCISSLYYCV